MHMRMRRDLSSCLEVIAVGLMFGLTSCGQDPAVTSAEPTTTAATTDSKGSTASVLDCAPGEFIRGETTDYRQPGPSETIPGSPDAGLSLRADFDARLPGLLARYSFQRGASTDDAVEYQITGQKGERRALVRVERLFGANFVVTSIKICESDFENFKIRENRP